MIDTLKKILQELSDLILFAYLFGSKAMGTDSDRSDIDIAVYIDPKNENRFFDIKTDLYLAISRKLKTNAIDIVILNQCRNIMLLDQIIAFGKLLYQTDQDARLQYEQKIFHNAFDFKTQRKRIMGV